MRLCYAANLTCLDIINVVRSLPWPLAIKIFSLSLKVWNLVLFVLLTLVLMLGLCPKRATQTSWRVQVFLKWYLGCSLYNFKSTGWIFPINSPMAKSGTMMNSKKCSKDIGARYLRKLPSNLLIFRSSLWFELENSPCLNYKSFLLVQSLHFFRCSAVYSDKIHVHIRLGIFLHPSSEFKLKCI